MPRTLRYQLVVKKYNPVLFVYFILMELRSPFTFIDTRKRLSRLFLWYHTTPLWFTLRSILTVDFGLYTNNMTLSSMYWFFKDVVTFSFMQRASINDYVSLLPDYLNLRAFKPVSILNLSFINQIYNPFIYYLFNFI